MRCALHTADWEQHNAYRLENDGIVFFITDVCFIELVVVAIVAMPSDQIRTRNEKKKYGRYRDDSFWLVFLFVFDRRFFRDCGI